MEHLDTPQQKLEAELTTLIATLKELGIQNPQVPEDWIATPEQPATAEADTNIVADRAEDWIGERGEMAELETRYNNVVLALSKIKAGAYGTCDVCGAAIEPERLEANPAARTCTVHMGTELTR